MQALLEQQISELVGFNTGLDSSGTLKALLAMKLKERLQYQHSHTMPLPATRCI